MVSFKLRNQFHHVFNDTHGILIKSKINEVLLGQFKERVGLGNWEQSNDHLNEMCGVRMTAKLKKVFLYTFAHQLVLFFIGKELYQSLNCMRALLVSDNVSDIFMEPLHHFETLSIIADAEQFLHHVICVFMSDKIRHFKVKCLNNQVDLLCVGFIQKVLKLARL